MATVGNNLAHRTVVLANNRNIVIEKLREVLGEEQIAYTEDQLANLKSIKSIPDHESLGFQSKGDSQGYDLYLRDINKLRDELTNKSETLKEGIDYLKEDFERSPDLSNKEEKVHKVLTHTIDILDRAFNRRTTLTSWGLFAYLKYAGLEKDDFNEIKSLCNDVNFIKKYTTYLELKSIEPEKALEPFSENEKKLVKLLSNTTSLYNGFNLDFVKKFPIWFTVENIALPILGRISNWISGENNFLSRAIEKVMVINPWVNEFAESLGNYFKEVEGLQKTLATDSTQLNTTSLKPTAEIELSNFENTDEYNLNKIISTVDSAAERLVGKGNTVSSIVLGQVLEKFAHKPYDKFIKEYKDNPEFVKKFKAFLSLESSATNEEVFKNPWDNYVANIVKYSVKAVNSFSDETLKKITNYFGFAYAVVNPLTPFLSLFIRKGPFAWLLHALRDTLPLINDLCIDHLANFRKEVMDIKEVTNNETISNLFPDIGKDLHSFMGYVKGLWTTVKDFSENLATYIRPNTERTQPTGN